MTRQCSNCGTTTHHFARGGGPHNRLCESCASDAPQTREVQRHPHGQLSEEDGA